MYLPRARRRSLNVGICLGLYLRKKIQLKGMNDPLSEGERRFDILE